jgi:hypothetical protein
MKRRSLRLFAVGVTALGSAGCAPVNIGGSWFLSGPAGESVLLNASSLSVTYLRKHSLENGALLASAWLYRQGRGYQWACAPALPGRIWCLENSSDPLSGHGLRLRDAESLEIIAEQDQLLGRTPDLAGTPLLRTGSVDPKTRGFRFESRDGYAWIIDPTTLTPRRFDERAESSPMSDHDRPLSNIHVQTVDGNRYDFTVGTRGALVRDGVTLHPEHTYLRPMFVPIRLDNPPCLLILEEVTPLDDATLWCVAADGTATWKVTHVFQSTYVTNARLYRDTVVLVTPTKLVALRTRDGAVVWTSPP